MRTGLEGRQFAIVAGSGFQSFADDAPALAVDTKFGPPAGRIRELDYGDRVVYFLPRHGEAISIPAHAVNYRANMKALSQLGTQCVIALNTVGSIPANVHPGQIAVPDQIIDYTWGREHSIYGDSDEIDHIDFTSPFSTPLRHSLVGAARAAEVDVHDGGIYMRNMIELSSLPSPSTCTTAGSMQSPRDPGWKPRLKSRAWSGTEPHTSA